MNGKVWFWIIFLNRPRNMMRYESRSRKCYFFWRDVLWNLSASGLKLGTCRCVWWVCTRYVYLYNVFVKCVLQKLRCEMVLQHVCSAILGEDQLSCALSHIEFAKPNSGKFWGQLHHEEVCNKLHYKHTSLIQRVSCLLGTDHMWT